MKVDDHLARVLKARASALASIRQVLTVAGALEVVTPIAGTYPDLAPVPQFKTTHPNSGTSFILRIAPEEHLTRLIARGIEAVFEVSTNFRVETLDATHLIEFQSVEAIFANRSPSEIRGVVETLCRAVENGVHAAVGYDGQCWCPPDSFEIVHLPTWVARHLGSPPEDFATADGLHRMLVRLGCEPSADQSREILADAVINAVAQEFDGPVFIASHPDYLGGPAKPCPAHDGFLDRSELYVGGLELGSLANQVTDITALRARYQQNFNIRERRGITPNIINEPCLDDYSRGLPAYCGLGLGIDRLLMLSLGISDVRQLHPFLYE